MAVYKRGKYWYVDYYFACKRFKKGGFTKKSMAVKYLTKMKNDILYKKHPLPRDQKIKFEELAQRYIELHSKPNKKSFKSDLSLMKKLVLYFGDYFISKITRTQVDQYRNERLASNSHRGTPVSKTTVNRELALLRSTMGKAVEWGLITIHPIEKLNMYQEFPKERILSKEEMVKLINGARDYLKDIILIALNTGMRKREILNLTWQQVDLENEYIKTRSKTRKIRLIPMNQSIKQVLSKLLLKRAGRRYVFENPKTGKAMTDIKTGWMSLLKCLQIHDLRFHDLRHTFATYTLLHGGDLISLKEILGHTQITTTARYAKALLEGQKKLVDGFNVSERHGQTIDLKKRKIN